MTTAGNTRLYAALTALLASAAPLMAIEPIDRRPHAELVTAIKAAGHERVAQGSQAIVLRDSGTGSFYAASSPSMVTTNKQTGEWTISVLNDKEVGSIVLTGTNLTRPAGGEAPSLPTFRREKTPVGAVFYPDEWQKLAGEGYRRLFSGHVRTTMRTALETAAKYPRPEIDTHIVKLTIEGKEFAMPQADLRRSMEERIKQLKEQRARLDRGDTAETARIDRLLKQYGAEMPESDETVILNLKPVFADVLVASDGRFKVFVADQFGTCVNIMFGTGFGEKP